MSFFQHPDSKASFFACCLIGAALMAAVDEIVFHQLLAWHHFYDRATPLVGLVSDGFLHAAELIALVVGFLWLSRLRSDRRLLPMWGWAGLFLGAGGFQVFDGLVDHKLLRVHQIRYGVENLWVYDLAWNLMGFTLIVVGLVVLLKARKTPDDSKALGAGDRKAKEK